MLIFFLDHLAHSIQIDRLIAVIERATRQVLADQARSASARSRHGQVPEPPAWAVAVRARKDGYAETIHPALLAPLAERLAASVRIALQVRDQVAPGHPIAYAWRASTSSCGGRGIRPPPCTAGPDRLRPELQQDIRFGLRPLVDIALRALSPAVNDPYTGIEVIERLIVLLCALAPMALGDDVVAGPDGSADVGVQAPSFRDYIDLRVP